MKKKEQFDKTQEEIEEEEKKLVAIAAEKENAYGKNSIAQVVEKAIKRIEELGEQLKRDFEEYIPHIHHHIIDGQENNSSSQHHLEQ